MSECIFCDIVAGEAPASFVHRDELVSAFLDIRPVAPGHLLVIPNVHAVYTHDLPDATADRLFAVARRLSRNLRQTDAIRADGINLFVADGEAAEQEVLHAHLHVIPRFPGDGFEIDAAAWHRPPPNRDELDALAALLREAAAEAERTASVLREQHGADARTLREAWEAEAPNWVAWARTPGHDSYWRFHRDRFLALLPAPPAVVLDIGCGEGRLPRDLKAGGYEVIGIDASPTLIKHAREADPGGDYRLADAAQLPLPDRSVDVVTALLSLHDMDELDGAVREAARVLVPGGRLCAAVVHPINSAGRFEAPVPDADFVIRGSYLDERRYADTFERDGLRMTFTSRHRPLQAYFVALEAAGFLVERLAEVPDPTDPPGDRWRRLPLFLHLRAVKR